MSPAARFIGLCIPSTWVLMTAIMWWAWRLTAVFAREELTGPMAQPVALISGMFADLLLIQVTFGFARLTAVAATASVDLRHVYVTIVKRLVFALFFLSTMLRILDVVQSAMVHHEPDVEFWLTLLREPDALVFGPVFGAVVISVAATAIGRYALGSDLEITQSVAEYWDQRKSITLTAGSLIVCLVLSLGMMTGKPYGGRGRLVEVGATAALIHAVGQRSAAARPHLNK